MNNTGSFGSAIGGADAIKQAMASRGLDTSVLNQQSPASAGFNPQSVLPTPPQGNVMPPQAPQTTAMGNVPDQGEDQLIIKALIERLKSNSKAKTTSPLM